MQLQNAERDQISARSGRFNKRIGSTTYQVEVSIDPLAGETLSEKIRRMIKNEGLTSPGFCATMNMLQADALPIGGSKC
jgi:hypothetical protein